MELLGRFNNDIHTKEALIEFIHDVIDSEGLEMIYAGKDVSHVKQARELIDKAFEVLTDQYAIPEKPKETESAR